jgi:hypothetical protein
MPKRLNKGGMQVLVLTGKKSSIKTTTLALQGHYVAAATQDYQETFLIWT